MTLNLYLSRPDSTVATSIFARICYNGYQLKYYTSESIDPANWNKKLKRAKKGQSFKEYPEFNARLENFEVTVKNTFRKWVNDNDGIIPNPTTLKLLLDGTLKNIEPKFNRTKTFMGFFEDVILRTVKGERLQPASGKPYSKSTIQIYRNTLKRLHSFCAFNNEEIDFKDISVEFHANFLTFLTQQKHLATNTIGKDIKTIKVILNEATERGLNNNMQFKSRKFSVPTENTDSIYLSEAELQEMSNLNLSGNKRLDNVRDLFLIGCYTGLRYSDFSVLTSKHINDGMIKITAVKTGHTVTIPVHPTVATILTKYAGSVPPSISNQKTNDYLKEIGEMMPTLKITGSKTLTKGGQKITYAFAKWQQLCTHTARRSFATNEYTAGTHTLTIMAITGHKTEKAFLRYIKLSSLEHAQKLQQIWADRRLLRAV